MPETSPLRTCSKCGLSKPVSDYYIDKRFNIPYGRCKKCQNAACMARPITDVPITEARVSQFWSFVEKGNDQYDCWMWKGRTFKGGYGTYNRLGSETTAHRIAWLLVNGPIPKGLEAMHICDNPGCCNPSHIRLGTHSENMQDCVDKGRIAKGDRNGARIHPDSKPRGSQNHKSKLTEKDIPTIRLLLANHVPQRKIAKRYGVDSKTIHAISSGRTWKHVP